MGVFSWLSHQSSLVGAPPTAAESTAVAPAWSAGGTTTELPNGDDVVSSETSNGASDYQVHVQLYSPQGAAIGPAFVETAPPISLFTAPVVAGLSDGSYEAAWVQQGNYSSQLLMEHFSAQGEALGQATLAHYGGFSVIGSSGYALAGMPDGDFVAAWTVQDAGSPAQVYAGEFTPSGDPLGSAALLGTATSPNPAPTIETSADGHYVVSWNSPTGPESQAFLDPPGTPPQALGPVQSAHAVVAQAAVAPAASELVASDLAASHLVASAPDPGAASSAVSGGSAWLSAHQALMHPLAAAAAGLSDVGHLSAGLAAHGGWGASFV